MHPQICSTSVILIIFSPVILIPALKTGAQFCKTPLSRTLCCLLFLTEWLFLIIFNHFKEFFVQQFYESNFPPRKIFPNSKSCASFEGFITDTIMERVRNGSLTVIGMVGEVEPQHLVLPITIEPKNPRMCHDERFLNHGLRIVPLPLTTSRICHVTSTKIITKLHSTIKAGMTISSSTHLALRILV